MSTNNSGGNVTPPASPSDPVNSPSHYKLGGVEVIDALEAWRLGYHLGNVVKYVARASHKGNYLQDLKKARWYLEREIERAERGVAPAGDVTLTAPSVGDMKRTGVCPRCKANIEVGVMHYCWVGTCARCGGPLYQDTRHECSPRQEAIPAGNGSVERRPGVVNIETPGRVDGTYCAVCHARILPGEVHVCPVGP